MTYKEFQEKVAALDEEIKAKKMAKGVIHLQYAFELNLRFKEFFNKKVIATLSNGLKPKGYFGGFEVVYSPTLEVCIIMYAEKKDGTKSRNKMYVPGSYSTDFDKLKIELA